jgi:HD superfamily phosphohydrolase YqeK
MKLIRNIFRNFLKARPSLVALMIFMILLGCINWLLINQKVILYMFYLPVVFAAWILPRRDSLGISVLAALMVVAYVFFRPEKMVYTTNNLLVWTELIIWGGILVMTAYMVATLRSRSREALLNLEQAYKGVLAILSRFIETVDADTETHSVRVSAWAVRIGQELKLNKALIEELRIAGLLHDVGKVDVSVDLLRKSAALSEEEHEEIRKHTANGAALVKPVGGILANIADAIENHHEKYDGTGYKGLKGEEISFVARIIAVADAFDALMSDRSYRKGVGIFEALDSITSSVGRHFDPLVVTALQKIVNREGERALSYTLSSYPTVDNAVAVSL